MSSSRPEDGCSSAAVAETLHRPQIRNETDARRTHKCGHRGGRSKIRPPGRSAGDPANRIEARIDREPHGIGELRVRAAFALVAHGHRCTCGYYDGDDWRE